MNNITNIKLEITKSYFKRLDFYWKFISVYAIAIIIYAMLKGSIEEWTVTVVFLEPVVILLSVFILLTTIGLIFESFKNQLLIIGSDFIVFKNRFRERKFTSDEITRLFIGKERAKYTGKFRIIKIKLTTRKRPVIIRPTSYWNEKELIESFVNLKKNIDR